MLRSPQNSHSYSTQGSAVRTTLVLKISSAALVVFGPVTKEMLPLLLQVRQNSSSPTSLSFGDHMMHPKQLAVKFVQVWSTTDEGPVPITSCSHS